MSISSLVDLDLIGTPNVVETLDFETLLAALVADFIARAAEAGIPYDVDTLETDPTIILMQVASYREIILRARVNDAARMNLLAFATGTDLDHVGANASPSVSRMPGETDDRFRLRILLAQMARNVGSEEFYRLTALSADISIVEALPYRLGRDPRVYVALLTDAPDGVASPSLIAAVQAIFDAPANHLVNSDVTVRSAVTAVQNVVATVYVRPGTPATVTATMEAALRAAWAREGGIGGDLTVQWIASRLLVPGVYSVAVTTPAADVVVPPYQATSIGTVTLSIVGENQ